MYGQSITARISLCALAFALSACGGGSGGGVNSTPPTGGGGGGGGGTTTPPPSGVNADLIAPLQSETFAGAGAEASIRAPTSGANVTTAASSADVQIVYQASTQTYTVTVGGRQQSFAPGDRSAAQSSATLDTYVRTSGGTTDSLSLIKTGTGAGQTRYVGGAFWQRQVNGTSSVDGYLNAATYGIETAAGSVPRMGEASYDVTLLGSRSYSTSIIALSGTGRLDVDFSTGGMFGVGSYVETFLDSGITTGSFGWNGYALLESDGGSFAGKLNLDSVYAQIDLEGLLYGPAAEEIGAVFYARPDAEQAVVGALLGGRGSYPVNSATSLISPQANTFFQPVTAGLKSSFASSGEITAVAPSGDTDGIRSVLLPTSSSRVLTYAPNGRVPFAEGLIPDQNKATFFAHMLLFEQVEERLSGSQFYDVFAIGFETPAESRPLSGIAVFDAGLAGAFGETGGDTFKLVRGFGQLDLDFAAGSITTNGGYSIYDRGTLTNSFGAMPGSSVLDSGNWTGTAQLASEGAAFSGTLQFDGNTAFSGDFAGTFFGPEAQEFAASTELVNGQSTLSALLYGRLDDAQTASFLTLSELAPLTAVTYLTEGVDYRYSVSNDTYYQNSLGPDLYGDVYFDASATPPDIILDGLFSSENASFSAERSDATVNVYLGAPTDLSADIDEFELRSYIFDGQDGRVELTYSGFAEIQGEGIINDDGSFRHNSIYIPFGNATPFERAPSGSATLQYETAKVGGRGWVWTPVVEEYTYYELSGNGSLDVTFATGALSSSLAVQGVSVDDGTPFDFGTFTFAGSTRTTSGNLGFSAVSTDDATGALDGIFFGPNAEEFGATFEIEAIRGVPFQLNGAMVGAQVP